MCFQVNRTQIAQVVSVYFAKTIVPLPWFCQDHQDNTSNDIKICNKQQLK